MGIVLLVLSFLLLVIGIVGTVIPGIPSLFISYIGLLLLQYSGYGGFSTDLLLIMAAITLIVTVIDNFLPPILTKRFGGSRLASVGSFLGLVIGTIFFAPLGIIMGAFFGALIGELIHDHTESKRAFKVALGSLLAFVVGTGAKLVASVLMLFYAVKAMF